MTLSIDDRNALLSKIESWPGLGATSNHSLEQRQKYAAIEMPHDEVRLAMASLPMMSSCTMTALAWFRAIGVNHNLLDTSYVIGSATSNLITIARSKSAWREEKSTNAAPSAGDVIVIGQNGNEHGLIVTSYSPLDGILESIDGGQGQNGAAIERRTRRLGWDDGSQKWWVYEGPSLDRKGRSVYGWVDIGELF